MAAILDKSLSKASLKVNPVWLPKEQTSQKVLWDAFMESDLCVSTIENPGSEAHPDLLSIETTSIEVKRPMLVQVDSVEDIGKAKHKPSLGIGAEENKDEDEEVVEHGKYLEGTEKEAKTEGGPKMLKIGLKSAHGAFFGIEMERIPILSPDMKIGTKLILKAPFVIRRGIALLWKKNCEVLKSIDQLNKL